MTARGTALITGVGPGLGASLCRCLLGAGFRVAASARSPNFGAELTDELAAPRSFRFYQGDVTDPASVVAIAEQAREDLGTFTTLVHNASSLHIAPFAETDNHQFEGMWRTTCLGAVNSTRAILPDLIANGSGTLIFSGATASLRGGNGFSAFAAAKFAQRGLAQSLAREYGPAGIHVAHVIIDGLIWAPPARDRFNAIETDCLSPEAIAQQYLALIDQTPSAWTHELDLRPYAESF